MSDEDLVHLEIDGVPVQAPRGAMLIEVTDREDIRVPRFCYHKKLSVAANCRMCLVEVEKAPKPLPACATPVMEGMKVFTHSRKALEAQRATMEFLLINHPLDCPICVQGGECELQDVAMGYGKDVSRYNEAKRVVRDKDLGPLVATDMTRCIHCTRCVRFGEEISGVRELGATGRGEFMEIGTFVEHALSSELSGNVIDLCPVGALTAKPSRMQARAWELIQHPGVAPHDLLGANVFLHTLNGRVVRVVPRENEALNETWLSDRDRFSYQGLYASDRVTRPMVRRDGQWREVDWESALDLVAERLRALDPNEVGGLASPSATVEELYLFQRLLRGLGINNLDHRLRQADFSAPEQDPLFPWLGMAVAELEHVEGALVIGSDLRHEQPLLAHRLRKASARGAKVVVLNPRDFDLALVGVQSLLRAPSAMVTSLAGIARAVAPGAGSPVPSALETILKDVEVGPEEQAAAAALADAGRATVLLGALAMGHPDFAVLRALAAYIAQALGAPLGYLPEGGNAAGAWLAGVVPHREPAGQSIQAAGLTARGMLEQPRQAYVTLGVEPEFDCGDPALALAAMRAARFVLVLSSYTSEAARDYADVILPTAGFAESSGTYVNGAGHWQSVKGACPPPGEARPGWKILRVLGNHLGLEGFSYLSSEEVRDELRTRCEGLGGFDNRMGLGGVPLAGRDAPQGLERISVPAIYRSDALVRRATALQDSPLTVPAAVHLNPRQAETLGLSGDVLVEVRQGEAAVRLPVVIDEAVAMGCAWIPGATEGTQGLGPAIGEITLRTVEQSHG